MIFAASIEVFQAKLVFDGKDQAPVLLEERSGLVRTASTGSSPPTYWGAYSSTPMSVT